MMKQKVKFSKELKVYIKPHALHWIDWYRRSNTATPMNNNEEVSLKESKQGRMADALALGGDEGRDKLR